MPGLVTAVGPITVHEDQSLFAGRAEPAVGCHWAGLARLLSTSEALDHASAHSACRSGLLAAVSAANRGKGTHCQPLRGPESRVDQNGFVCHWASSQVRL